ncbi:EAL domain-containing protein [Mangrovibacillus cuniculi]|uniref:EAL domain-containing protein n=1 Tax=Mangrovibacillus cuniculi TaxID=2593652 RepID=A0A7S8CDR6_9BACI|nr:EAL domain-containing protein [Mangrovibacillus cuniculi]QPC48122.1 EAL domain-containing protein [Mangrovibacillus cuniculi]
MNSCVHCGVHYHVPDSGTIHIALLDRVLSYTNHTELVTILEKLSHNRIGEIILNTASFNVSRLLSIVHNYKDIQFIQSGKMMSYLQPIITLEDHEIYGYESLLRSNEKDYQLRPGHLFSLANDIGLHSRLDQRAREEAIKARSKVIPNGTKSFINFLPSTIYNPDFCLQHTFSLVEKYAINPQDLIFEVVETERIDDVPHLLSVLKRYKQEGMKVALDDVGAGFATLDVLSALQPDYVKIDRGYITNCHLDTEKQKFLHKVKKLSLDLGFKTLAEGVETKEEYTFCKELGLDLAQGYYIQKPQPPDFFKSH